MTTRKCPACNREFKLPPLSFTVILPPTGGDYEWAKTNQKLTCPHCNANLEVEVRQSLSGEIEEIGKLKLA